MYTTISMTSITPSLHEKKIIIKQMKILPQDIFFFFQFVSYKCGTNCYNKIIILLN